MTVSIKLLKEFGQDEAVLAPADGDGDPITVFNQLIILDGFDEGCPELFAEVFSQLVLNQSGTLTLHHSPFLV